VFVPEDLKTQELCLVAVQDFGRTLDFVPEAFKTPELCLAAVQQDVRALQYVPDELKTAKLCLAAIQAQAKDRSTFWISKLEFVPDEHKTPELCLAAVQQYGDDLQYVPDEHKTPELCLAAVQQYVSALQYVPDEHKTQELCLAAVQHCSLILESAPEAFKTPELCLAAVQQYGDALQYVPDEHKAPELCLTAVQQDGSALQYVPQELVTTQLCIAAVKNNGETAIKFVPSNLITHEFRITAVTSRDWAPDYVPEEFKTPEVSRIAEETREAHRSALRTKRLLQVEKERRKIIAESESGQGLFTSCYSLPDDLGYKGPEPLYYLEFTASLSRKFDDIFYLYRLKTYDGEAQVKIMQQIERGYYKNEEEHKRMLDMLKAGVEITPYFFMRGSKDGGACIEVVGVVDVYSFDCDGIAKAINMFLDGGEVESIGEPLIHKASKGFLKWLEKKRRR
jgi:hypothetical protein